jgi:hypothetical protein
MAGKARVTPRLYAWGSQKLKNKISKLDKNLLRLTPTTAQWRLAVRINDYWLERYKDLWRPRLLSHNRAPLSFFLFLD